MPRGGDPPLSELAALGEGSLLALSGIGRAAAAAAARALVDAGVSALMTFGMAGGLDPALETGTVVMPRELISSDGARYTTCRAWREQVGLAVNTLCALTEGNLLTSSGAIETPADKAAAFRSTGAVAVDMESAAVAEIAAKHNLPFIAVRVIVDTAADELPRAVVAASRAGKRTVRALDRRTDYRAARDRRVAAARAALSNRDALIAPHRRASRMKALVTGATGFVGAAVARALLGAKWQVRVLARPSSDRRNLQDLDVEVAEGDLADASSLERAAQGCEALFHVAADYRLGARDPAELYRTNVEGTRNILSAAQRPGVRRIVYTSSVATIGIPADGRPGDERYAGCAREHDRALQALEVSGGGSGAEKLRSGGISVVIVSPSTPVGPGRCEAHAHRTAGAGCGGGPHAGLRRYRVSTSCTSMTSPPGICWPMSAAGSASATSWAART